MALSIQKRWEINFLKKHIYGPKWNDNQISEFLGIHRNTVKKWVERYEESGDVEDIEGRGRKRKTLAREDQQLISLFENNEEMTLAKAQSIMKRRKLDISKATIWNRLREAEFKATFPLSKPLLTSQHIQRRLKWCELAGLMIKIYKRALLPSMKKFNFDKDSDWQFQEDNHPKHTSN